MAEFRIVVVGAGGVGKSAITVRFIQGNFVEKYDPTIEDSYRKQVEVDGVSCMVDVMDTAGQEEYSSLRDQYMKTAEGFVVVYSITSSVSFDFVTKLRVAILRIKEHYPDIPIVLVGNKKDLAETRQVATERAQAVATEWGCELLEVSAKTNENVNQVFLQLIRRMQAWRKQHPELYKKKSRKCVLL